MVSVLLRLEMLKYLYIFGDNLHLANKQFAQDEGVTLMLKFDASSMKNLLWISCLMAAFKMCQTISFWKLFISMVKRRRPLATIKFVDRSSNKRYIAQH